MLDLCDSGAGAARRAPDRRPAVPSRSPGDRADQLIYFGSRATSEPAPTRRSTQRHRSRRTKTAHDRIPERPSSRSDAVRRPRTAAPSDPARAAAASRCRSSWRGSRCPSSWLILVIVFSVLRPGHVLHRRQPHDDPEPAVRARDPLPRPAAAADRRRDRPVDRRESRPRADPGHGAHVPAGPAAVAGGALSIAGCTVVGLLNGLMVTRLRINSLIATLGDEHHHHRRDRRYTERERLLREHPRRAARDRPGPALRDPVARSSTRCVIALLVWYVLSQHAAGPVPLRHRRVQGCRAPQRRAGAAADRLRLRRRRPARWHRRRRAGGHPRQRQPDRRPAVPAAGRSRRCSSARRRSSRACSTCGARSSPCITAAGRRHRPRAAGRARSGSSRSSPGSR